jgi:hypothetical protein
MGTTGAVEVLRKPARPAQGGELPGDIVLTFNRGQVMPWAIHWIEKGQSIDGGNMGHGEYYGGDFVEQIRAALIRFEERLW